MHRELIHLFGPLGIQSYGTAIAIGVLVFVAFASASERRKQLMSASLFFESVVTAGLYALIGGRLLFWVTNFHDYRSPWDIFFIWDGGFSVLGSIIAVLIGMTWFLRKHKLPVMPYFDLITLYAPLLQSIARLGCLCAGCCHGLPTSQPWGLTYCDPEGFAPLHVPLHPTQVYSSLALLAIFFILRFGVARSALRPGTILWSYLALEGTERFIIDFWRADRTFIASLSTALSIDQIIAFTLIIVAVSMLVLTSFRQKTSL